MGLLSISGYNTIFQFNQLSYAERERIAYVMGDCLLASTFANASDLENEVDLFDALLEHAKKDAFQIGKCEGVGLDTAKVIADLESELKRFKEQNKAIRGDLEAVMTWLVGDTTKTVAGRKKCASEIRRRLQSIPR